MNQTTPTSFVGQAFVDLIGKNPWLTLVVGLLALGSLTPGLKKIQADFTHTGFFFDDDPMLLEFNAFERQFGNDDSLIIGVHSPSGIFDVDSATLIQELTEQMWLMPDIIRKSPPCPITRGSTQMATIFWSTPLSLTMSS